MSSSPGRVRPSPSTQRRWPGRRWWRSASTVPRPRALLVLGALGAVAGLGVVAAVLSVEWRVIDFGPAEALAAFLAIQALTARLWARGLGRGRSLAGVAIIAGWIWVAACLAISWVGFGGSARAVSF